MNSSTITTIELQDIPLFKSLAAVERILIQRCLRLKDFEKGDMISWEGNACQRVFIVKSGRVKMFRTSAAGREQILEIMNPGDTCACNPGSTCWNCSANAQAMTACTVWFLMRDDYVKLIRTNANMTHAINKLFADRLCRFSSLIVDVSLNEVKKRLIKFLLDMAEQEGSFSRKGVLFTHFTREEIAQRIGAARETVVRQLHELKRIELIDIKPQEIIIRDKLGLQRRLEA